MTVTPLTEKNIGKNKEQMLTSIAMRRFATPEDLAGAYLFLASEKAAGYISGVNLPVAGAKFCAQDAQWGWKHRDGLV